MKRRWLISAFAVLIVSVGVVQAQLSQNTIDDFLATPSGRAFLETFGALKTNYLNDVDDEAIIQGAINGMIEALDDPYTNYIDPKAAARSDQDQSGSFEGIGATLSPRNRKDSTIVEIVNVFEGSPAQQAGIQRGDIFVMVDDTNVENATVNEVVDLVRGPGGTPVNITMRRPGQEELINFTVIRDTIEIVDVESTVLPNNVGYITIKTFANQRIYDQLVERINALKAQGIDSLILDLRDNGGGFLTQGILVADEFLTKGDIVFQRSRGVTQRLATADAAAFDLPMVVLVNKNSASASEIVAGALQDNGRAIVIGEETFGKGVGQTVNRLSDGGELVLLNFEWLTPSRRSINKTGITPDVFAEDTRFPNVITLEGQGATPGQTIEIVVDGNVLGSTTAEEDGSFTFLQGFERPEVSSVQGEALVDINNDNALQVAYDTVLSQKLQQAVEN